MAVSACGVGIIPALAGNTCCTDKRSKNVRDHPRACGEHVIKRSFFSVVLGSSPRLRGTPRPPYHCMIPNGIIPALAGNTMAASGSTPHYRDHPRACGEHCTVPPAAMPTLGSSPRLRGTLFGSARFGYIRGIIPALAGNTLNTSLTARRARDHPRACGEHERPLVAPLASLGSSPRLRGTRPLGA